MKKTLSLFFVTLFVFTACKKDEDKPSTSPSPSPSPSIPAVPKIKSTRTQQFILDSLQTITTANYLYNGDGQLLSCTFTDSIYSAFGWSVETSIQLYNYTPFNKIASLSLSGNFGFYITEYIYNSNEKLIAEVQNGGSDTLRYTYAGNQIIGERTSNSYNQRFYYSENLDSTIFVDISNFTSQKVVYKRNAKVDAISSYMNPYYGIVANKHELVQEVQTNASMQGSNTTTNNLTRTYYPNGFPKTVTIEQGTNGVNITHFTYF